MSRPSVPPAMLEDNGGEVIVATLNSLNDAEQMREFFAALKALKRVGKVFAFKHVSYSGGGLTRPSESIQIMALKEEK